MDFEFSDERYLASPYAQELLRSAKILYPLIKPRLGYVDEVDRCLVGFNDAKKLRLKKIAWVNFFSPEYVEEYGERFFLDMPAHLTERLSNGGIFIQLTPSIIVKDREDARNVREIIQSYCADNGHTIKCCSPYYLKDTFPFLSPTEIEQIQSYARDLIRDIFLLEDGTHLKVINVPWSEVSPTQQQAMIADMRTISEEQLSQNTEVNWRIELNELPTNSENMLSSIKRKTNANLEWLLTA